MKRDTEVLSRPPRLAPAFARSLIPRSRGGSPRIPTRSAVIENLTQDRERLAAYDRLTGFTLRDDVPPTWLHVLTFPLHIHLLSDPESSIRLLGAVHVSNRMTLHRPVGADERLTLDVHLDALRPHARGALVDLIGQVRVDGEPVWDGVSTYLAQGVSVEGEPHAVERQLHEPSTPHSLWRLPVGLGRDYRSVSGDPNPIHTSRIAARVFGFPRPIIHGMWTHARALAAIEPRLPPTYTVDVAFTKPILLPATVGLTSTPTATGHAAAVTDRTGTKPHLLMSVVGEPPNK
ncbi:MaoC/PaaZ C-terminal domain-containing protein [Demequina sp.]|uniref:MaoC/PaaZ C-terminal domain-containing protein n=1 Tax=Demequina sp. TaxID=2050685 RepID=UPI0025C54C92|nr:MaoC/PaaZ C-terminal domain-containing protein [Demequina sp.]